MNFDFTNNSSTRRNCLQEKTIVKPKHCHYSKGCDQEYFDRKACPVRTAYAIRQLERQEDYWECLDNERGVG